MKPIVQAMKSLEGENDCCLGHVMGVERKILERKILERKLQSFHDWSKMPLVNSLLVGLRIRFAAIKNNNEYKLATILHPKYKLAVLPYNDRLKNRKLLLSYVSQKVYNSANNEMNIQQWHTRRISGRWQFI